MLIVLLNVPNSQMAEEKKSERVVLPNPHLLRCKSSDCFQLWPANTAQQNAIFPKQFSVDMNQDCLYGMTATYDKTVSLEAVKESIDAEFGKWALKSPLKLWRVEPEKFAIQLSVTDKKEEKAHIAEEGTKQVIYIAFGGRSACSVAAQ
jgi:hypothetical protein